MPSGTRKARREAALTCRVVADFLQIVSCDGSIDIKILGFKSFILMLGAIQGCTIFVAVRLLLGSGASLPRPPRSAFPLPLGLTAWTVTESVPSASLVLLTANN
jgi:hypothetical protein